MTPRQILRIALIGIGILVALLLIISSHFALRARKNFLAAESEFHSGDVAQAILHYDATIRNYSLLNFWVRKSRDRLLEIARTQERQRKPQDALNTYQTLLSALASVETGYSPNRALVRELEQKVAHLRASMTP
jgi:hypothetical protein